jgi:hypothetical protein
VIRILNPTFYLLLGDQARLLISRLQLLPHRQPSGATSHRWRRKRSGLQGGPPLPETK